ncbi:MAG: Collagen adhesin precursor [Firmicutes bacterium ADurb.Bin182]|nr:MAG: Collagen adhesin precursor [Firmicutes bacterium ADurb.Bin182]
MKDRMKKRLSLLIAVLMVMLLFPSTGLADTSVHVRNVPDYVEGVEVNLNGGRAIICMEQGNKWTGSDNGEYITDQIVSVTLIWDSNKIKEVIPRSFINFGVEGGGSGTLNIKLQGGWNKTSVSGTKTWVDNNNEDGKRPSSITVALYADGNHKENKTVTAGDNWQYSFTNLSKYNNNGVLIAYTVDESSVADGYTKGVDGYDITNTYTPPAEETGSLKVIKKVTGNAVPTRNVSYSFSVSGPNGYTNSFTITGAGSHILTELKPGEYTVTEDVPAGSEFTVDGAEKTVTVRANKTAKLTFTNTYCTGEEETCSLTVKKIVEGKGAPKNDEFKFKIRKDGRTNFREFTLTAGEEITFADLKPGQYTVTETDWPKDYAPKSESKTVTVNSGDDKLVTFTNVYDSCDEPVPPRRTYAVFYHPNGGSGTIPSDMNRYYSGDKVWLKSGDGLYMPKHIFAGWSLKDGTRVYDPYIMGKSDVTFYAVWVPVKIPKTGDTAVPYGILMIAGGISLAALNLIFELRKRRLPR